MHKDLKSKVVTENPPESDSDIFRQYLDIAGVTLLVLGSDEKVKLINKKGCEVLGYPENEIIGKNWFDNFLPKQMSNEVKLMFGQLMNGKEPGQYFENPILRKNGEERIIYWHNTLLFNNKGKVTGVLSSGEDITEIRNYQIELKRHSETMESLYSLSQELSESFDFKDLLVRVGNILSNNPSVICGCFYLFNGSSHDYDFRTTFGNDKYVSILPDTLKSSSSYVKQILEHHDGYIDKISSAKIKKMNSMIRLSISMHARNELLGILSVILKDSDEYTLDFFKLAASEAGRGIKRKKIEQAQKQSEEKFYSVFQTSPDSIAIATFEEGVFLEVNEKFTEITGFKRKEIIGKRIDDVLAYENKSDLISLLNELKKNEKVANFETILRKNDRLYNVLMSARIIDYNGQKSVLAIIKDITDRIKTEKEIIAAKELLEKITDTSPAFISVYDIKEDKTIYRNKSLLKSVGYNEEDIKKIASTPTEKRLFLYHPDDIKNIVESDRKILELSDGQILSLEFRLKDKNEKYNWFRHSMGVFQRDENGKPAQSVNIFENITDKKNTEELIENRNKEINLLYEAGKNLAGTLDLTELYDRMYETISLRADCDEFFVTTYDDETKLIKYYYLKSKHAKERIDVTKIPPIPLAPEGFGILSETIRTGISRIIDDYQESLKKVKTSYTINEQGDLLNESGEESEYKPKSAMIVPIKLESKVFGVVQIFSGRKNAYTKDQLSFAESLMHLVALANNNAILYQKAQDEIKERKSAEESLRKSEERVRHFSESVPDVLYRIDLINLKYDFLSPSLEKMLGYTLDKALENPLEFTTMVIHPDDKVKVLNSMHEFISKGPTDKPFEVETRMIRKDGKIICVRDVIRFTWENGKPVAASGIMSDISERKKEEEKRRLRNEQIIKHQSALLEMSKFPGTDIKTSSKYMTEITSKTLEAERVSIWIFNEEKTALECLDMYNNEEKSHKYDMILDKTGNKKFFDFITSEEKIYSDVKSPFTQIEESAKGYLLNLGTTSAIFAGIRHRGDIAGFICFESMTPGGKEWTPEQRDFVVSTSNIVTIALETDERQKAEEETLKSLKDKELLLKEIHHRVKNNLAVVSSLLYLQSQKTQNKQILDALLESQLRLKSMVLVHEKLYRSKDLSSINYSEYIETLAATLFRSYEYESKRINLELDVKDIYLDTDTATNLGLIINELISNSIKHAFPEERTGKIAISFNLDQDGLYTLIVKDDGVSMPHGFDFRETETLGLKLVSTLTEQIEGTLTLEKNQGTCFKIQFRKQS